MNLSVGNHGLDDEGAYATIWNNDFKKHVGYSKHDPLAISNAGKDIEKKKENPTYRRILVIQENHPAEFIEAEMIDSITAKILTGLRSVGEKMS